jgi:3-oxoacyl-[acyl-carrier protein] reductase
MKRILVTGASRGIGRAIAVDCARRFKGAIIGVGFHASREAAEQTAREIGNENAQAILVSADVSDGAAVERAFASFADEAGGIDALVANAGTHVAGLLATTELDALERLVRVNTLGPLACARAVLPRMLAQKRGLLLFIGSIAAARPTRGQAAYAATKGSVEALTRAIAVEYGKKGIRAICIRPGAVMTDMLEATIAMAGEDVTSRIPVRRVADPSEVGRFASLLLSDEAAYASGAIIDFDGGYGAS